MERIKIIVVDDDPNCSRLVRTILERTGYFEVKVVNRPREAVSAAREFKPDVFVLDVDMPGMDGGELSRDIEADAALFGLPILFLTGLISEQETRGGPAIRGGKQFLSKPPAPIALISAITQLLSVASNARPSAVHHAGNS